MATMNQDDRIFLYWLAVNHYTRGARVGRLLAYLEDHVGVL